MSTTKTQTNAYNKEGRLYQVEYAMKASSLGTTTIGIQTKDFVILLSEKKSINSQQILSSVKKHQKIYDNIVFGHCGIAGDARSIAVKAREYCVDHDFRYNQNPTPESLLKHLCNLAFQFGEEDLYKKIFSRPFGVSILVASFSDEPKLYLFDPSGSYRRFKAKALGAAAQSVETELIANVESFTEKNATIKKGLEILKKVMRDSINENNVEIDVVDKEGSVSLSIEQIRELLLNV